MGDAVWYYKFADQVHGPVSASELRQKAGTIEIQPDSLVRKGAEGRWMEAEKVRWLFAPVDSPPVAGVHKFESNPIASVTAPVVDKGVVAENLSESPWGAWDQDASKRALDDLFSNAAKYRTSESYRELLQFITRFHTYAPFNAMLVHVQKPGAKYVLPAHKWMKRYRRRIKPGAQALVILQPMGPVMFVFDVSETEGEALPPEVEDPFALKAGKVRGELAKTIHNAKRDGIRVSRPAHGSQRAGSICRTRLVDGELEFGKAKVPLMYELLLNVNHDESVQYSTLVHELAHLYCGHLGTPHTKWWPDRHGLPLDVREFEAESACYLICQRIGLETKSDEYLAEYYSENKEVPPISLERVLVSARLIEQMGQKTLPVRKKPA